MTQDELFLDLDCSAEDVAEFLYEDDGGSRRLALGAVLDLVASAFDMAATREAIAFDARIEQLPSDVLRSLRLRLSRSSGAFAVDVDRGDGYETSATGQRLRPPPWPDGTASQDDTSIRHADSRLTREDFVTALSACAPPQFARLDQPRSIANGLSVRLVLTPTALAECERFSLHPLMLTTALRTALLLSNAAGATTRRRVAQIERVAIVCHGAVPDRMAVRVDPSNDLTSLTANVTVFDETGRLIAELAGIMFSGDTARAPVSMKRIAELAVEALGRSVSSEDNLLQLGATSLDLVRLVTAVYGESRAQVSLESFLACPTLQNLHALTLQDSEPSTTDLAERLEQLVAASPIATSAPAPLTSMQQALWLASLKRFAAPAYIESAVWRVRGTLDIGGLTTAWIGLAAHFESLRSAIFEEAGRLSQRVLPPPAALDSTDTLAPAPDAEPGIDAWTHDRLARPFRLGERLARVHVLRIAPDDHLLLLAAHHAVCDGSSFAEHVIPELAERYACARHGRQFRSTAISAQPRHLAHWELDPSCAELLAREAASWAAELSDVDAAELQTDRPRSATSSGRGARHVLALPSRLADSLTRFARREGQSQFVVALAAFGALLYRFAGQRDLLIGVPVAQRFAPSLTRAAGCLVNFAPVRMRLDGALSAYALLQATTDQASRLLSRQRIPFQLVAQRLSEPSQANAANPRIGFSHELAWPYLHLDGLELEQRQVELTQAKLELFLRLEGSPHGVRAVFEYDAGLFEPNTIATLAQRYLKILESFVEDPATLIAELPWLETDERRALLAATRGPSLPIGPLFPVLFDAWVRSGPDRVAVTDGAQPLTYAALDSRAQAVAAQLREANVQRGECVVIYLEGGVAWPVAVLGSWMVGAVIVPIDSDQPRARRTHMFAAAQARIAITRMPQRDAVESFGLRALALEDGLTHPTERASGHSLARASPSAWELQPDDIAFGIFTSGSTGLPKLALANHGGLANKALGQLTTFRLQPGARVLQFASPAFDAALSELILALSAGATLVCPPRDARYGGETLTSFMANAGIEVAMLTPTVVATLPASDLPLLRLLLVVGERCSGELVERWAAGRDVYNLYGPTETTIWATSERCESHAGDPTLGRPIPNAWVYVLDRDLNLLGPGQVGEICIGGLAVGPGYRHASDTDRARFLPDPYAGSDGGRIYRTGDRGHWSADGRLVFDGRDDDQVKLSGRRIALGEIEDALRHIEGVADAVVVVHEQGTPRARLSAFVQTAIDDITVAELRNRLRSVLPHALIPAGIAIVERWPRLVSGKIDRKALTERPLEHVPTGTLANSAERAVADAFAHVLGIDPASIGPEDDFFSLGGRSLDIVKLAEELARVGVMVAVVELLQASRVSELAILTEPDTSQRPVPNR